MIEMIGIYNWFYLSINGVALGIEPINISLFDGCIYSGSMMDHVSPTVGYLGMECLRIRTSNMC